ncbi:hypothetical protein [Chenggangzhangella methanolivorans]|uniref:hypothetical protein n=1 Tax=Chenggangzhangella methanolivorans TaxID=1437009 RepID=UPI0021BDABD1|nr:hypothetical protein [Chenggangzhangella methanolivorans]
MAVDEAGQLAEAGFTRRGVELLIEAQEASQRLASAPAGAEAAELRLRAAPYEGWLLMNRAFLERDGSDPTRGWRLFQLAFVLAHIPTLASRMPEYRSYHDARLDEDTVSLLYFPTGGGKSEAFYGTLLFGLFLDRLRGKSRGVSVLIRYPLRLLTLQQAQRLLRLLVNAELIRRRENIGSWPFEIASGWARRTRPIDTRPSPQMCRSPMTPSIRTTPASKKALTKQTVCANEVSAIAISGRPTTRSRTAPAAGHRLGFGASRPRGRRPSALRSSVLTAPASGTALMAA